MQTKILQHSDFSLCILGICIIEVPLYLLNGYICFNILGIIDVGGAVVIHTFVGFELITNNLFDLTKE